MHGAYFWNFTSVTFGSRQWFIRKLHSISLRQNMINLLLDENQNLNGHINIFSLFIPMYSAIQETLLYAIHISSHF